jgi:hypothetical protein
VPHLEHRVKVRFLIEASLGMAEPPWKRLGAVAIVPWLVEYIKDEKVGIECGWGMRSLFRFK